MHRWLRQLPNLVSAIRILLIVPIALSIAQHRFVATLWLFALAAVSDALDGYLAKRFGWQTQLGGMLDPVADKAMLATVFLMLAVRSVVPVWLTAAVIARDCVIVVGAISYTVCFGWVAAKPSGVSKVNTLSQILFILCVIGALQFGTPPAWVSVALGALVFVTVVVSGIDYVLVYGRLAAAQARGNRSSPA